MRSVTFRLLPWSLGAALLTSVVACSATSAPHPPAQQPARPVEIPSEPPSRPSLLSPTSPIAPPAPPPPAWIVGAHPLPLRPDGFGVVLPTPPELVERMLPTADLLPPPTSDSFESTIEPVPAQVLNRSTWRAACPVSPSRLRYLTMSFHGFDGRLHTGEMLVNSDVAEAVVAVFERLFAAHFPIEEMRVVDAPELNLPPTGDGSNTSAFVCRPARGQTRWSAHAYGLAIDLNPFHNPYRSADLVLPELASAYLIRDRVRPGMVLDGGPAVSAFEAAGWTWGGRWSKPTDWMHFSATGS
ncbi:MAG: M15 family metallopeptidase [Pseudonocardiaceae bacterium]